VQQWHRTEKQWQFTVMQTTSTFKHSTTNFSALAGVQQNEPRRCCVLCAGNAA